MGRLQHPGHHSWATGPVPGVAGSTGILALATSTNPQTLAMLTPPQAGPASCPINSQSQQRTSAAGRGLQPVPLDLLSPHTALLGFTTTVPVPLQ